MNISKGAGLADRRPYGRARLLTFMMVSAVMALMPAVAHAYSPYTHVHTARVVWLEITNNLRGDETNGYSSFVTIQGRNYPVPGLVAEALWKFPEYFNAGVIGPDGFPDLTYGQSIIHPQETGQWLRYVLDRARAAQAEDESKYTKTNKLQILAFAYGFLAHAAGDMWAHTLVNDFTGGVFPDYGKVLHNDSDLENALRHIIVEGYIKSATAGVDNNFMVRKPVDGAGGVDPIQYPGLKCLVCELDHSIQATNADGTCADDFGGCPDISEDSTPGIDLPDPADFYNETNAVPIGLGLFLYETLVDPQAPTPDLPRGAGWDFGVGPLTFFHIDDYGRGPLLDLFLTLRQNLKDEQARLRKELPTVSRDKLQQLAATARDLSTTYAQLLQCTNASQCASNLLDFNQSVLNAARTVDQDYFEALQARVWRIQSELECLNDLPGALQDALGLVNTWGDLFFLAYITGWIDDIDTGLKRWPQFGLETTRALFDPTARRLTQNIDGRHFNQGHTSSDLLANDTARDFRAHPSL